MMPRRRVIIIGLAAVVLLGGAVTLLALMPESGVDTDTPSNLDTVSTAPAASIIDEELEDVLSVVFTPADGGGYTLTRNPDDESYSMNTDVETMFPPQKTEMSTSFQNAISIPNAQPVTDAPDDEQLKLFGLNTPFTTVRINLADGTSTTLDIGAVSAVNSGRYVRINGEGAVYILTNYFTTQLTKPVSQFNDYSFLPETVPPATDDNESFYMFTSVTLTRGDSVLQVTQDIEARTDFVVVQPTEVASNYYTLSKEFLIPITNIKPSELVEEHPADLTKYGLDNPAVLELEEYEGWKGKLLIGNYDSELEGRYVMIDGIDAVLLDKADAYLFLEATPSRLRTALAWANNITEVSSIDFYLNGVTRRVEYQHYDDGTLSAKLDGVELTEQNARRLYSSMLSVSVSGDTDEEIPGGEPAYKFVINFNDGTSGELALYELNYRQYLMVLNGESMNSYTSVTTLRENLLNKFEMLDNGEELPYF